jgi:hypothetical protein
MLIFIASEVAMIMIFLGILSPFNEPIGLNHTGLLVVLIMIPVTMIQLFTAFKLSVISE